MGIYRVSELHDNMGVTELCYIKHKCVMYPDEGYFIAIPIVHMTNIIMMMVIYSSKQ